MSAGVKRLVPLALLLVGMLLTAAAYHPGLKGPWLLDDFHNLDVFNSYAPDNAPYEELVFGNRSGPLGRSVSMASFALNHAAGLFSSFALKSSNLLIHLLNGALIFLLAQQLFRIRPAPGMPDGALLAGMLALWWLLLPLHTSTVLYIVQRMTQLGALFSLATCLAYTAGRQRMLAGQRHGTGLVAAAVLLLLPLALLAKEIGVASIAWMALIELFFFRQFATRHRLAGLLLGLAALTVTVIAALVMFRHIEASYVGRDFTLGERLLSQPRAIWNYIAAIFIPDGSRMGIFHDDFAISRSLLSPATTLPALSGLLALFAAALWAAGSTRWWPVAFGILFFLAGHLLESTVLPLELYFEHRNYLPALGLLLAAAVTAANLWQRPPAAALAAFALYIAVLGFSTLQRAHIWGDRLLLAQVSAENHPHSLRAWSDYSEVLLAAREPVQALQAAAVTAERNPGFAAISHLQMLSIYCRLRQAPPPALIALTAASLRQIEGFEISLTIGLEEILTRKKSGDCGSADFSALVPALIAQEQGLTRRYGGARVVYWHLRLTIAEWLADIGHPDAALDILRDIWLQGRKQDIPTVGLTLAQTLHTQGLHEEKHRVIGELRAVTQDAPPDFLDAMNKIGSDEKP